MGEKGKREEGSSRHSSSGTGPRLHPSSWDGRMHHRAVSEMMHVQRRPPCAVGSVKRICLVALSTVTEAKIYS